MGAPHNGLANDALMTLVKGKASESLIEELGPGSPTLNNLKFKFDDIAQNVKVLSIFERRKTKTAIEVSILVQIYFRRLSVWSQTKLTHDRKTASGSEKGRR